MVGDGDSFGDGEGVEPCATFGSACLVSHEASHVGLTGRCSATELPIQVASSVPGRTRTYLARFRKPLPIRSATRTFFCALWLAYGDRTRLLWVTARPRH